MRHFNWDIFRSTRTSCTIPNPSTHPPVLHLTLNFQEPLGAHLDWTPWTPKKSPWPSLALYISHVIASSEIFMWDIFYWWAGWVWVGKRGFPTPGSQRAVDGWGGGGGGELGCFNVYAGKRGGRVIVVQLYICSCNQKQTQFRFPINCAPLSAQFLQAGKSNASSDAEDSEKWFEGNPLVEQQLLPHKLISIKEYCELQQACSKM